MRRAIARSAGVLASAICVLPLATASASEGCPTLHEAARAALTAALPLSTQFEYGGALYVLDGCHGYTAPQTSGSEYHVDLRVNLPAGAALAGIYHTHPGLQEQGRLFSPADVHTHDSLLVPSFIAFAATGELFALDSTVRRDVGRGARSRHRAVAGKPL
jgi:proteasome lid subunit RPN8/RPN11